MNVPWCSNSNPRAVPDNSVIAQTSYSEVIETCLAAGAIDYISKPLTVWLSFVKIRWRKSYFKAQQHQSAG